MKSYIIAFDDCRHSEIRLPIVSSAGSMYELRQLNADEELKNNGVRFTIYNETGSEFVTGVFAGPPRDRDVPLEIARIHARGLASPMRIAYRDGTAYRYDTRFDCPIREAAA